MTLPLDLIIQGGIEEITTIVIYYHQRPMVYSILLYRPIMPRLKNKLKSV